MCAHTFREEQQEVRWDPAEQLPAIKWAQGAGPRSIEEAENEARSGEWRGKMGLESSRRQVLVCLRNSLCLALGANVFFPSWIRAQITGHNGSVGVHFRSSVLSFKAWLWDGHQREKICPNVDRSLTSGKLSPGKQEQINWRLCNTRFPKVSRTQGHKVTFSHSSPRTLSILPSLSLSNSWHSPVDFTPLFPPHLTRWNVFLRIF